MMIRSKTTNLLSSKSRPNNRTSNSILRKSINHIQSEGSSTARQIISHLQKNVPSKLRLDKFVTTMTTTTTTSTTKINNHETTNFHNYTLGNKISSYNSAKCSSPRPSKNNLFLDLKSTTTTISSRNGFIPPHQEPLSCPETLSTPFTTKIPQSFEIRYICDFCIL